MSSLMEKGRSVKITREQDNVSKALSLNISETSFEPPCSLLQF